MVFLTKTININPVLKFQSFSNDVTTCKFNILFWRKWMNEVKVTFYFTEWKRDAKHLKARVCF